MSATLYWRPLREGKALEHTTAPSSFMEYLENALERSFPLRLDSSNLPALNVAKRLTKDTNFQADIQDIIDAIDNHEEIEIWASY